MSADVASRIRPAMPAPKNDKSADDEAEAEASVAAKNRTAARRAFQLIKEARERAVTRADRPPRSRLRP